MKTSKYTEEQIAFALRQAETATLESCFRKRIHFAGEILDVQGGRGASISPGPGPPATCRAKPSATELRGRDAGRHPSPLRPIECQEPESKQG